MGYPTHLCACQDIWEFEGEHLQYSVQLCCKLSWKQDSENANPFQSRTISYTYLHCLAPTSWLVSFINTVYRLLKNVCMRGKQDVHSVREVNSNESTLALIDMCLAWWNAINTIVSKETIYYMLSLWNTDDILFKLKKAKFCIVCTIFTQSK